MGGHSPLWAGLWLAALLGVLVADPYGRADDGRRTVSFDRDWQFHRGDVPGAERPDLKVSSWRSLDLPHDWSIEGPFDPDSPGGAGGGYRDGGIGWYRKAFTLPESARGKHVFVQFDGVYMDSDVWLNGTHLGNHPYGYTSFAYDLTPHLRPGTGPNVLAVRVHVRQPCSRWYSGAGIYRHVWLAVTEPVHVGHWGTYVTTPEVSDEQAQVRVRTRVRNEDRAGARVTLTTLILDPDGRQVGRGQSAEDVAGGGDREFDQSLTVERPRRWSLEERHLYRAVSEVRVGDRLTDAYTTPFGIRTFRFTADKGFFLNGKHVPIRGVCDHHDLGCLGASTRRRGLERQLEILKGMGCNAIRTSHNPPDPELLELCDRMGFVVMDEAFDEWKHPKERFGYGRFFDEWSERDLVSMIRRDRNHPCIVLWSIGNEIPEQDAPDGHAMAQRLADICHREDPTRPVTSACHMADKAIRTSYASALDVLGINYHIQWYREFRGRVMLASETASAVSTRGEYNLVLRDGRVEILPKDHHQCTSYDLHAPAWGHRAETSLRAVEDAPWVAGQFVWTGSDYIGEPTPFKWPSRSSYFGIVDLCGFPKDRYYLYQSRWTDRPMVHILPHWNWNGFEGKEIPVWCFTNAESVELFLNGKSLGEKDWKGIDSLHLEWRVRYEPGVLKAVARKGKETVAVDEVHTAGEPAKLLLTPDRKRLQPDGEDLSFVEIKIVDKEGHLCPNADNKITFRLEGPARIAGLDNGDPTNLEPFQGTEHTAFHGLALVVVQSSREPGTVRLTANAKGLESEPVTMTIGHGER